MNERIVEIAIQAGVTGYFAANTEYATPIPLTPEIEKFAELIVQEIYSQVKQEIVDDDFIDAQADIEDRCYLRGNNGGIVDALCIIKNFGISSE